MILSCSRRTDIPAYYSEWLIHRLRAGTVCVVNPFNPKQISRVDIRPEVVDGIVFWSKNPKLLMNHLKEIDQLGYNYYFQFSLTPYDKDLESGLPPKTELVETFIELSELIGKEKVNLLYNPIVITEKYSVAYHLRAFEQLCQRLSQHTEKVMISFVDAYKKNSKQFKTHGIQTISNEDKRQMAGQLKGITNRYGLVLETCSEAMDLSYLGIQHGKCIDGDRIERIAGYQIMNKDKRDGTREACGCMKCIDIGQYNNCLNGCIYCYANTNGPSVMANHRLHKVDSEILIGELDEDLVTERKGIKSYRIDEEEEGQIGLFD